MRRRRWLDRVQRVPRSRDDEEAPAPVGPGETPVVPFVPVRCYRCGQPKPITDGVRDLTAGRIRYHICRSCGLRFHSQEIDPRSLRSPL